MSISFSSLENIALGVLLAMLTPYALALGAEILSFSPLQNCKMSPKAPPKNLLEKAYKIYNNVEHWQTVDINGDGWCDWIRGGYEGYRTDQEDPPMREFIYLGTSNGWREIAQSEAYRKALKGKSRSETKGLMLPYIEAFNFNQPIFVYSSARSAPYVVVTSRPDAPAPYPEIEDILVMRWDGAYDLLRFVEEPERRKVIAFTKHEICKSRRTPLSAGRTLFIKDALCKS
jgi:hypothetical protein